MESLCYISQKFENNENGSDINFHFEANVKLNEKNEYILNNLEKNKNVYINVLMRDLKTNQIIVLTPLQYIQEKGSALWFLYLVIIIIIGVVLYYKYEYVLEIICWIYYYFSIKLPIRRGNDNVKYSSLNDSYY